MGKGAQEGCQLFIEQEIEKGLAEDKTPSKIAKELVPWLDKLFEVAMPVGTIKKRAQRIKNKLGTNVPTDITPEPDKGNREKPDKPVIIRDSKGQFDKGTKIAGPGRPPKFSVKPEAHRTSFTGQNEWYTPAPYIEAARKVLGSVDLDPATSEFGQSRIKATKYYTAKDDGLTKEWKGNIWLNPPYSQPLIRQFAEKTFHEYENGFTHIQVYREHDLHGYCETDGRAPQLFNSDCQWEDDYKR